MKKIYYFYKITNKDNGKFYYGVHSTENLDDGYMGSRVALKKAILKEGINKFQKEIICFFDNEKEMLDYEAKIVTKELINGPNCYNLNLGGGGGIFSPKGYTAVKDKDDNHFLCKVSDEKFLNGEYVSLHKNRIICKNHEGKFVATLKNDERIKNGELVPFNVGMVSVKDSNDKHYYVSVNDERFKSGELQSTSKGYLNAQDAQGNIYHVKTNDERLLNGELSPLNKGKVIVKYDNGECGLIPIEEYKSGTFTHINSNKFLAIDTNGNYYSITKNDPRYINKELVSAGKGKKVITNGKETRYVSVDETIDGFYGVIKGKMSVVDANGNTFMCDTNDPRIKSGELVSTNKGKFLAKDSNGVIYSITKDDIRWKNGELQALSKGRKYDDAHSEKLRKARGERIVINNGINLKYINPKDLDKYLENGWVKGRLPFKHKTIKYYVNNGEVSKKVVENEIDKYIKQGWKRGALKKENTHVSKEELIELLKDKNLTEIGNMFGVTRNAVRYWCKNYNIQIKK